MSHLPTVWLKENQVRLVGSSRSFTCIYRVEEDVQCEIAICQAIHVWNSYEQVTCTIMYPMKMTLTLHPRSRVGYDSIP